ncbi:hypothetical protein [Bacillus massilinigeriensis]|uniref:hypothetical protein n=1 Tax=Bacillus mediterraneensis TaxID=1805474 RepID=UPI0008F8384B|nr:hypothetical protein [Bacillus mediterraneensis]
MYKRLFSLFSVFFILMILFLPLILVDIFIVHLLGGYYSKWIYLILFLVVFYIVDLVLSIFIDSLLKFISDISFITTIIGKKLISATFDFLSSMIVINLLDWLFNTVNLSVGIKMLIVFIHTLVVFLINSSQTGEKELVDSDQNLNPTIEYEISYLLQKEDMVTCINLIKEKYPDIPKTKIINTVRKINRENKLS